MECCHLPGFLQPLPSAKNFDEKFSSDGEDFENGDDVYPVFALDGAKWNRKYISRVMRFNDVLDAHKLNDALCRLLAIGDWRKLGGRVKLTDTGGLQIRVPKVFSRERPAVHFTHNVIESNIEDHPLGACLPKPTEGVSMHNATGHLAGLEARPDHPQTLKETYHTDEPQLSLNITTFQDATTVAWTFPHSAMDIFGSVDLLRNWSLVLAGREAEIVPLLGASHDVLLDLEKAVDPSDSEQWALGRLWLRGPKLFWGATRLIFDKFTRPTYERKFMYVPREKINRLVQQTRAEVATQSAKGDGPSFVTEGDVLAAWIARSVARSDSRQRPVTIVGAVNARFRFPTLLPKVGTYVQNMVVATYAVFSYSSLQESLGSIALQHRQAIAEQSTKPQLMAQLNTWRECVVKGSIPPALIGSTDTIPVVVNNTTKLDLLRAVDFGPAVMRQGQDDSSRSNPVGTPTLCYSNWRKADPGLLGALYLLGRDWVGEGNYWCTGVLRPKTWELLCEELNAV